MTESYRLNPYAVVSEMDGGYLICGSTRLQVRFTKDQKPFVDLLTGGQALSLSELRRYLAESRIDELRRKHILLSDAVPVAGRYSRQLGFFSLIADDYQGCHDRLVQANVLLLGGGAIGTHVLWDLAAMGVGKITLVDFDVVEETNLNRQLLFSEEDIGQPKVEVLCRKISEFNPLVEVIPVNERVAGRADVEKWMSGKTLVIKAIDTPEQSTEWVNEVCVQHGVPYVTGGFLDDIGIVGPAYIPGKSLCFACIERPRVKKIHGAGATFAPMTEIVASRIAMCVFRIVVGMTDAIAGKVYTYSTLTDNWETAQLTSAKACKVCGRPADKRPPQPKAEHGWAIWGYRGAIVFLMVLVSILRSVTHDQYIGLVMLAVLFLSMPALDLVCGKKPEETRWQIFFISSVYCVLSLVMLSVQGGLPFARTEVSSRFDAVFRMLEQISAVIIESSLAITCLGGLLYGFTHAIKIATGEREKWMP